MDANQIIVGLRYILAIGGGIAIGTGYFTADSWAEFTNQLLSFLGAAIAFGTMAYGIWKNRPNAIIAKAADLDQVVKPITTDPATAAKIDKPNVVAS